MIDYGQDYPEPEDPDAAADEPPAEEERKQTQAEILAEIAEKRYVFGQSPEGEPFALPIDGARVARPLRGSRAGLRAELAASYLKAFRRPPTSNALADVLGALEGHCLASDPTAVHLRLAEADGALWLDLGRKDGTSVRLDATGWRLAVEYPVTFRRTALTGELPEPVHGGDLAELRDLVNVTDSAWPLLVAWLVASLLPDMPHPVLALFGEQGTGKTTAAKLIASTVDASPAQVRTAPKEANDWAVTASGSWIVALDNISSIPAWLSDALCRAVTGDGMVRRALYTDAGISVLSFRRCLILTGIGVDALRGDLAERLLLIELERIPDDRRRLDAELAERWADAHPRVLGALLDLAVKVRTVLPGVQLESMPRMADFARVVAAVDQVLGTDALVEYIGQRDSLAGDVIEADAVAAAVVKFAESLDSTWFGSATDLLARLDAAGKDWPTSPKGLASRLTRAAPALRSVGVLVDDAGRDPRTRRKVLSVSRERGNNASHASDASDTPLTCGNDAKDSAEDPDDAKDDASHASERFAERFAPDTASDLRKHGGAKDPNGAKDRFPSPLTSPVDTYCSACGTTVPPTALRPCPACGTRFHGYGDGAHPCPCRQQKTA